MCVNVCVLHDYVSGKKVKVKTIIFTDSLSKLHNDGNTDKTLLHNSQLQTLILAATSMMPMLLVGGEFISFSLAASSVGKLAATSCGDATDPDDGDTTYHQACMHVQLHIHLFNGKFPTQVPVSSLLAQSQWMTGVILASTLGSAHIILS